MKLIIGTIMISLAVFMFCFVLLSVRNPRQHWWTSDNWVANFHAIVIVSLAVAGFLTLCSALLTFADSIDLVSVPISAVILAATVIGVRALKIRERLAEFEMRSAHVPPETGPADGPKKEGALPDIHKFAA